MFRSLLPPLFVVLLFRCGGVAAPANSDGGNEKANNDPADAAIEMNEENKTDAAIPNEACPNAKAATSPGTVTDTEITESSGLVASVLNPGTLWLHNDSGDTARAFAIADNGSKRATLTFDTTDPVDIEDMAIEDDGPQSYLYFGDIGDNDRIRPSITIHRVMEPKLGTETSLAAKSTKMIVRYPNGAHNAETLLFDPITKELLIVTKDTLGSAEIHRVGKFVGGGNVTTEKVSTVSVILATGGDISRDGKWIALRNYTTSGFLWLRDPNESLATTFGKPPCKIPIAQEKQGETLPFIPDGSGYTTVSEGKKQELHRALFE